MRATILGATLAIAMASPAFGQDRIDYRGGYPTIYRNGDFRDPIWCDIPGQMTKNIGGKAVVVPYQHLPQTAAPVDMLQNPVPGGTVYGWCHPPMAPYTITNGHLSPNAIPLKQSWPVDLGQYRRYAIHCWYEPDNLFFACKPE